MGPEGTLYESPSPRPGLKRGGLMKSAHFSLPRTATLDRQHSHAALLRAVGSVAACGTCRRCMGARRSAHTRSLRRPAARRRSHSASNPHAAAMRRTNALSDRSHHHHHYSLPPTCLPLCITCLFVQQKAARLGIRITKRFKTQLHKAACREMVQLLSRSHHLASRSFPGAAKRQPPHCVPLAGCSERSKGHQCTIFDIFGYCIHHLHHTAGGLQKRSH